MVECNRACGQVGIAQWLWGSFEIREEGVRDIRGIVGWKTLSGVDKVHGVWLGATSWYCLIAQVLLKTGEGWYVTFEGL